MTNLPIMPRFTSLTANIPCQRKFRGNAAKKLGVRMLSDIRHPSASPRHWQCPTITKSPTRESNLRCLPRDVETAAVAGSVEPSDTGSAILTSQDDQNSSSWTGFQNRISQKDGNKEALELIQERVVGPTNALEEEMRSLSLGQLAEKTGQFRDRLAEGATLEDIMPEAFAVVREVSRRKLGFRHYDTQIIGGAVLHQGCVAEMYTGEGKTLVATLPVYLNALTGQGVYVCTVNDYLAGRDAEQMGRVYRALGLTVGLVQTESTQDERKAAYHSDITYCTCQELGFDYLRDNGQSDPEGVVLRRNFNFAVVDEVDSLLVDEGRNPLVISSATGDDQHENQKFTRGSEVAMQLQKDVHYTVNEREKNVELLDEGMDLAEKLLGVSDMFDVRSNMAKYVQLGLKAKEHFLRDIHYVIKDDKVVCVDEGTGRVVDSRRWSEGIHQAVEAKEGVPIMGETSTVAVITFQKLFQLFDKLSGMTGTAKTEAAEFWSNFQVNVITVPPHKPNVRTDYPLSVYLTLQAKWTAVLEEILWARQMGRPVLVGTTSVEASEHVSDLLRQIQVPHNLLNARPQYAAAEAQVIAQAGRYGAVTIATNMAGRGTDILLGGAPLSLAEDYLERSLLSYLCPGATPKGEMVNAPPPELELHQSTLQALTQAALMAQNETGSQMGKPMTEEQARWACHHMMEFAEKSSLQRKRLLDSQAEGKEPEKEDEDLNAIPTQMADWPLTWRVGCAAAVALLDQAKAQCKREGDLVAERGGLHVIGTSVHESRRIDNQLQGRAGRQGDRGSTAFLVSFEDTIMQTYGSDLMEQAWSFAGLDPSQPIEHPIVDKLVFDVQRAAERWNASSRRSMNDYDSVLEGQRKHFYGLRFKVLQASDEEFFSFYFKYSQQVVSDIVDEHTDIDQRPEKWRMDELLDSLRMLCLDENVLLVEHDMQPSDEARHHFAQQSPMLQGVTAEEVMSSLRSGSPLPRQQTPELFPAMWGHWELSRDNASQVMEKIAETIPEPELGLFAFTRRRNAVMIKTLKIYCTWCLIHMFYAHRDAMLDQFPQVQESDFNKAMKIMSVGILGSLWEAHLNLMTKLRNTANLRSFGMMTPLEEYEIDGALAFKAMVGEARQQIVKKTFFMGVASMEEDDEDYDENDIED